MNEKPRIRGVPSRSLAHGASFPRRCRASSDASAAKEAALVPNYGLALQNNEHRAEIAIQNLALVSLCKCNG